MWLKYSKGSVAAGRKLGEANPIKERGMQPGVGPRKASDRAGVYSVKECSFAPDLMMRTQKRLLATRQLLACRTSAGEPT